MTETYATQMLSVADPNWDVPETELTIFSERRHAHALIIPVINEGNRIQAQLKAISALAPELDIIIADGGSTDGSLEFDFLVSCNVRAILVKRGAGALSAQLRMGYAFALDQGYDGILTMDGNGKDGVEALPEFIAALMSGNDYVQGSRYAAGGKAVNTPLDRTLGVRLLHAPLISLAAGRWMRDTTNGFRAYSATFLRDARVAPFRSVFSRYNLIFYLAIMASRLGYQVCDVPVTRSYPDRGTATPTKISDLKSKIALVGETLEAATGGYTPEPVSTTPWIGRMFIALIVGMLGLLFYNYLATPKYNPDSWAVFDLSQSIFNDFYATGHIRSYLWDLGHSSSFPPLWPAMLATFDAVFQSGARTGYVLSFLSFALFCALSEQVGRAGFGVKWVGAAVAVLCLVDGSMLVSEVIGGRSIPLQMALIAGFMTLLLKTPNLALRHGLILGGMAGLMVMNRFDALPVLIVLALGTGLLAKRFSVFAVFALSAAVMLSPWVIYSLRVFDVPFVTDNSAIALSIDPSAYFTDWWPAPQANLFDDPLAWAMKIIAHLQAFVFALFDVIFSAMGIMVTLAAIMGAGFVFITHQGRNEQDSPFTRDFIWSILFSRVGKLLILVFVALGLQLSTYVVTGYFQTRYFAPLVWLMTLIGAGLFVCWGRTAAQRQILARFSFALLFLLALGGWVINGLVFPPDESGTRSEQWVAFDHPAVIEELERCMGPDAADARLLVLGDSTLAAQMAAVSDLQTLIEPSNISDGRLSAEEARFFAQSFGVDYVLVARDDKFVFIDTIYLARPVPDCSIDLYRFQ